MQQAINRLNCDEFSIHFNVIIFISKRTFVAFLTTIHLYIKV